MSRRRNSLLFYELLPDDVPTSPPSSSVTSSPLLSTSSYVSVAFSPQSCPSPSRTLLLMEPRSTANKSIRPQCYPAFRIRSSEPLPRAANHTIRFLQCCRAASFAGSVAPVTAKSAPSHQARKRIALPPDAFPPLPKAGLCSITSLTPLTRQPTQRQRQQP